MEILSKKSNSNSQEEDKSKPYGIHLIILFGSQIVCGIFQVISVKINSEIPQEEIYSSGSIEQDISSDIIENANIKEKNDKKSQAILKRIILCGICEYFAYFFSILTVDDSLVVLVSSEFPFLHIGLIFTFSYFILNYSFQRHQKLSLIIIYIGSLLMLLSSIILALNGKYMIKIDDQSGKYIPNAWKFLMMVISPFFFSYGSVMEKNLMQNFEVSPYNIMFYKGFIGLSCCLLFDGLILLIKGTHNWDIFKNFKYSFSPTWGNFMFLLSNLLFVFAYKLMGTLTNYYYTPMHNGIAEVLSCFGKWVIEREYEGWGDNEKILIDLYHFCGFGIIFIGVLVYTEIIIFNCCGMEKYIKREIGIRRREERIGRIGSIIPNESDGVRDNNNNNEEFLRH